MEAEHGAERAVAADRIVLFDLCRQAIRVFTKNLHGDEGHVHRRDAVWQVVDADAEPLVVVVGVDVNPRLVGDFLAFAAGVQEGLRCRVIKRRRGAQQATGHRENEQSIERAVDEARNQDEILDGGREAPSVTLGATVSDGRQLLFELARAVLGGEFRGGLGLPLAAHDGPLGCGS